MLHDLITITPQHESSAKMVFDKVIELRSNVPKNKMIVTISGEVGSGKSTISIVLGRLLTNHGVRAKIIDLDDFYKIPPLERRAWRLKHGIESIGYDEYDWESVDENIDCFMKGKVCKMPCVDLITKHVDELTTDYNGVDMLIINGLYSLKIKKADLKVFIEQSFDKTLEAQQYNRKEKLDDYRLKVLQREHEVVNSLKGLADFYIDFETSFFHL
jgi:uridine kinase